MSRIKYSPIDKRELAAFEGLCKRIDKLDSGAAKYLRRLGRNWNPVSWSSCGVEGFAPDADLSRCFCWDRKGLQIPVRTWCRIWGRLEAGEA